MLMTNRERAERADRALTTYARGEYGFRVGEPDLVTATQDLITDLMHLLAREKLSRTRVEELFLRARANYEDEVADVGEWE